ncbi:MAG: hypothetical protein JW704_10850 [Anaerolineaceae bacterium]|nr:hypothetical protein [Anaerolineaceae bacterium]MBN2677546.1 hypothetical protein [Anaerolineaceae bacterium]
MLQEFSPKEQISRSLNLWWVLAICIMLGGGIGYLIHRIEPPVYQVKAIINTFIDFQDINDASLSQYDEDMTINSVKAVMLSNAVIEGVINRAAMEGISINYSTFMERQRIYRAHTDYELFYLDPDPETARKLVNYWAEIGVAHYHKLQEQGNMPLYVTVTLASLADLPLTPTYSQANTYVLSGALLGFVLGLVLTCLPFHKPVNKQRLASQKTSRGV